MLSSTGEAREADEEEADAAQRLTETSRARGQEEEEDTGEEEDELTRAHCSVVGTAHRRRKRRGSGVQANGNDDAELKDINGEVRDGRSSAADENSG